MKLNNIFNTIGFIYRAYPKAILLVCVSALVESFIPFIFIIAITSIVNDIIYDNGQDVISTIILICIALTFGSIIRLLVERKYQIVAKQFDELLKYRMHISALKMPYNIFTDKKTQDKIRQAEEAYMYNGGFNLLLDYLKHSFEAVYSVIIGICLFYLVNISAGNAHFTAAMVGETILIFSSVVAEAKFVSLIMLRFGKESRNCLNDVIAGEEKLSYFLFKVFNDYQNGKTIRMNRMQSFIMQKYNETFEPSIEKNIRLLKANHLLHIYSNLVTRTICGVLMGIITILAMLNILPVGMIVFVIGTFTAINDSVQRMINETDMMNRHIEQIDRYMFFENVHEVLNMDDDESEICDMEFVNVGYKYENSEKWALRNVNIKLSFDKIYSIVGENGSGKTTFIKLILGLFEPTEGEILINGKPKNFNRKTMIRNFSVVFQDYNLYAFSVGQNIACSNNYNKEKVEKCIDKIDLTKTVEGLNEKLDTLLYSYDDKGIEMSGGELQKIAISREEYKKSPIWVLDEPTASLDPKSEEEMYEKLISDFDYKSCIFVSHRMSSCTRSDEVIVFSKGNIVEHGLHNELLHSCDYYFRLWNEQLALFT